MKVFPAAVAAALAAGEWASRPMLRMDLAEGVSGIWGGETPLTHDGCTYSPVAGAMQFAPIPGQAGLGADVLEITISGLDAAFGEVVATRGWHQRPAVASTAFLDASGAVVHVHTDFVGYLDTVDQTSSAELGRLGTIDIVARVESAARELGRANGRTQSDADQRAVDATDTFFRYAVEVAAQNQIYWGREGPKSPK